MKKKTELKTNIEWLKDIEWLKREIKEINPYTLHTSTLQKKMLELIDQLDKPETLSQKWIDEHKQHITRHSADKDGIGQYHNPPVVSVYDLQNLLVPKQEEIGVPEWFAEWFKGRGYQMSLYGIFNDLYTNSKSKMEEWSKKYEMGHAELQNDIASIKLHGKGIYEVEEEPKCYVVKSEGLDDVHYYFTKFDDEMNGLFTLPNDKKRAYRFEDKEKAQAIANYTDSEVEEME